MDPIEREKQIAALQTELFAVEEGKRDPLKVEYFQSLLKLRDNASAVLGSATIDQYLTNSAQFENSVGRLFRLYPSGLYGCCGTAVAISKSGFLTVRHTFETKEEQYEGPIVVYIAFKFLIATIDARSHGLDVVHLTLSTTEAAIQPLLILESRHLQVLQPVALVHFPLLQDNSIFNTYCAIMKEKQQEDMSTKVREFKLKQKVKKDEEDPGTAKGIEFVPGSNVLSGPVFSSGTLSARYPERGRGYANYQCFQNSSGGAVIASTAKGWQLVGIHLGSTTDDMVTPLFHLLLSKKQLTEAGIKPRKRSAPKDNQKRNSNAQDLDSEQELEQEVKGGNRASLSSEEAAPPSFLTENLGYFSFVTDIALRLRAQFPEYHQSITHNFIYDDDLDDDLYDDDT